MKLSLAGGSLAALAVAYGVSALQIPNGTFHHSKRQVVGNGWDLDGKSYDYVIIGGGTAGLALANRLSADDSNTVAVIEAGNSGYDDNEKFTVPAANLYDSSVGTQYDWQWRTTRQSNMNNRRASWPRGKVLGGSSAINGLYYVRHSKLEQSIWADLNDNDGRWSWDSMLGAMEKSEHFDGPTKKVRNGEHIQYNADSHGTNGPIHTTWPAVTYAPVGAFLESAASVGASASSNGYGGKVSGTFSALSSINKDDWTRSFSRTGYLDPVSGRSNLHVLTGHTVTKINFDNSNSGNARATSVNYAASRGEDWHEIHAKKEVILSAGTINDPQILQLSGIGSRSLLESHGIDVVVNLPGVGQNLQDHLSAGMSFAPKNGDDVGPQDLTGSKRTDSFVNHAVSYVHLNNLFKNPGSIISRIQSSVNGIVSGNNVPNTVKNGQHATYGAIAERIFPSTVSPLEILGNVMFGSINIQAALQHPLSRGSIKINSGDAFDSPSIDPGYLTQDIDLTILREGFKLIREMSRHPPLSNYISHESSPGNKVQSNSEWEDWIRSQAGTEYHPSCTCSMLPRNQGGVVGADLKVHGTSNLRVVDASVPPISFSAHLQSITYGIAEIAADIILDN
ncbi:hypothetical protein MSPP1_002675 [Malassezia sp. CBS 17886]|nr:hypothetical protein MSPP1_002675 [Malassezia sp. CBS 17886]